MIEGTEYYWQKKLDLSAAPDESIVKPSRLIILRPIFFKIFRFFSDRYFPIKTRGLENLPKNHPYIIACNHSSYLDYPTLVCVVDSKTTDDWFVLASKAYFDMPGIRGLMKLAANIVRLDIREDFFDGMRKAAAVLKLKKSLVVFPEGTRSKTGEVASFKAGLGVLAIECGVPVIPVYIEGASKVLPREAILPKRGKITVNFEKPIDPEKFKKEMPANQAYDIYKELAEEVQKKVLELKNFNK